MYHTDFRARAIQPRYVVGARFDVPAPRDMSAAYVEWALSCHAESASLSHPNDPVRVSGVHDVSVRAVGSSLRIAVTGADRTAGAAILERARALQRSGGSVQARQAADLGTDGPTL